MVPFSEISKLKDRIIEQERMISCYRTKEGRVEMVKSKEQVVGGEKDLKVKLAEKDHTIAELKRALNSLKDISEVPETEGTK